MPDPTDAHAALLPEEQRRARELDHELPTTLRVISLNCWGLKYVSALRHERLTEIGRQLAAASPPPDIVGLQECWTQQDYRAIRDLTRHLLPHGKFYWSGVFGGGLAILSRWPILESQMARYPLNGRPAAFWRGDWYVGKGVACARIRLGPRPRDCVEVLCTHLHAPYEPPPRPDSYLCHRTAQAWEIARLMRHAAERGHLVLALGDFNMLPGSLAHRLIETHSPARDLWRLRYPDSALGSAADLQKQAGPAAAVPVPSALDCLRDHGATCDSTLNTWRWSKAMQKDLLRRGKDSHVDPHAPDLHAKRLDYIFFYAPPPTEGGGGADSWEVEDLQVGMTMRHPTLLCSLSDHFSVEATLRRHPSSPPSPPLPGSLSSSSLLPPATYAEIQHMTRAYLLRQRRQRRQQLAYFWAGFVVALACLVAVWWSPHNGVAFALCLLASLALASAVIAGLLGFLFVKSELRSLKEFLFEIDAVALRAETPSQPQLPPQPQYSPPTRVGRGPDDGAAGGTRRGGEKVVQE